MGRKCGTYAIEVSIHIGFFHEHSPRVKFCTASPLFSRVQCGKRRTLSSSLPGSIRVPKHILLMDMSAVVRTTLVSCSGSLGRIAVPLSSNGGSGREHISNNSHEVGPSLSCMRFPKDDRIARL
jgi:hypothetical protein